jgi:hypothetical protein
MWKLRLISTDTASLAVAKDTEKEDRYKLIKDSWESAQPGRATKARESRDQYLKQVETGAIKPVVMVPPSAEPMTSKMKMRSNLNIAKGYEVVYKPWTILKDTGAGGRTLNSFNGNERNLSVFGPDGERLTLETPVPPPSVPQTQASAAIATQPVPGTQITPPASATVGGADKRMSKANVSETPSSLKLSITGHDVSHRPSIMDINGGSGVRNLSIVNSETVHRASVVGNTLLGNIAEYSNASEERIAFDYVNEFNMARNIATATTYVIPKVRAKVLTSDERLDRVQVREQQIADFEKEYELLKQQRQQGREQRTHMKQLQSEKLDEVAKYVEKEKEEDMARREAYRQRVIKEMEEAAARKLALEAQRAAELAALEGNNAEEQAAAASAAEKGKKKGGKK